MQVGTALFVAPEVMHNFNNEAYDGQAADVWAMGVVLFITLFGKHPFLRAEDCTSGQHVQVRHQSFSCDWPVLVLAGAPGPDAAL
jgi:serine/threonine protein kinase